MNALVRRALVLCLAIAGLLMALAAPAVVAADPTTVTASAEPDGELLIVSGQVTSRSQGVRNADVHIGVDAAATTARTDNDGVFRATLPLPDPTVSHRVQVTFGGRGNLASASVEIVLPGSPAEATAPGADDVAAKVAPPQSATAGKPSATEAAATEAATKAAEPAQDLRAPSALEAVLDQSSLEPGELLTITGTLTAGGSPLASSEIHVWLGGKEHADSLTFTGEDGSFFTFLEVPTDQPPGDTRALVAFPGGASHLGSEKAVTVTVEAPEPETTAEPQPTLTLAPSAEASPEASAARDVDPDDDVAAAGYVQEDADGTTASTPSPAPLSWFWIAAVVVGGSAMLVTIALLMRRNTVIGELRDREDGVGPLHFLDEEDEDDLNGDYDWSQDYATASREAFTGHASWTASDHGETRGEPTASAIPPASEPGLSIYRDGPHPMEQPQPRRSWSGED